jgi:hypothetical protein
MHFLCPLLVLLGATRGSGWLTLEARGTTSQFLLTQSMLLKVGVVLLAVSAFSYIVEVRLPHPFCCNPKLNAGIARSLGCKDAQRLRGKSLSVRGVGAWVRGRVAVRHGRHVAA